ncbi:MAG: cell division protein ZapB [Treponema sp.]|nr:cell division protein ZapB [Treponema sp.]
MVSLEQIKLLESKVTKAVDYVKKVTEENKTLKGKLDSYQERIDELEVLIQQFKEEQSRIENGILSALDRLNQFEDAVEKALSVEKHPVAEKTLSAEKPAVSLQQGTDTPEKKEKEASGTVLIPDPEVPPATAPSNNEKSKQELDIF